jgi:hydrogenase maturation protease
VLADRLFIGLGSAHGDDRAGWLVADDLAALAPTTLLIRRAAAPMDLLHWLDGIRRLGVCDACCGAGRAGHWQRWTWPTAAIDCLRATGSHDLGLPAVLNLAARLGLLPDEVFVWGIEVAQCQPNDAVSSAVAAAVSEVARDAAAVLASSSIGHPLLNNV